MQLDIISMGTAENLLGVQYKIKTSRKKQYAKK